MKPSILKDESYQFAILVVRLFQILQQSKKEFVISKQVLKSGTAIGALIREAEFAQSRSDFANKMSIALKEANETGYWISLLNETGFIADKEFASILQSKCRSLIAMPLATVKKAKIGIDEKKNVKDA
jgi:four helix bundle protein